MASRCSECNSHIVWNSDGIVCCSKCGVVVEDEVFEKVSYNIKSRYYKKGFLEFFKWLTKKEKKVKRRDRGLKDFNKISKSNFFSE